MNKLMINKNKINRIKIKKLNLMRKKKNKIQMKKKLYILKVYFQIILNEN